MQIGFRFISVIFIAGLTLPAPVSRLIAQVPDSTSTVAGEVPEAPHPQAEVAAIEPLNDPAQVGGIQSSTASGSAAAQTAKKQHDKTQSPVAASTTQTGFISGTAVDVNGGVIPGASVAIDGPGPSDHIKLVANDSGNFEISNLQPGNYHITISAKGFVNWVSPALTLQPGQFMFLTGVGLKVAGAVTSVTVSSDTEQIAVEQVHVAEQQRIWGIIPNFYVTYDPNPVPLTTKLKYQLAFRTARDPLAFIGAAAMAGIQQAADTPGYVEGTKGYAERYGEVYAGGFTDIMFGGAILPALLHQDPRYYFQGTGTKKSRALHALSNPFICKGDNGKLQVNFSSMGGDLAAGAISNAYYPASDRGPGLVFDNFAIDTGERLLSSLVQEFFLHKFTSHPND